MPRLALLVDPDADARRLYRVTLTTTGWDVDDAEDGREALAKAISSPPELIVTETRLPGMSGFDLCVRVRADLDIATTPILAVTSDGADIPRAINAGADRALIKPCLPDRFSAAVLELRAQSRRLRQRADHAAGELEHEILRSRRIIDDARRLTRREQLNRRVTNHPPKAVPELACPTCERLLRYERSYLGGVNAEHEEQWDVLVCGGCLRWYQYRHRTRRLSPFGDERQDH